MAKVVMFASIDSFTNEDLTAMFEVICKKIIGKKPNEVKKDILLVKGKPAEIEKYQVNVMDIMNMVVAMDIKFDFKINYLEGEDDKPPVIPEVKATPIGEQKQEITNPELKEVVLSNTNVLENANDVTEENKGLKPGEPPPPPPFLT